jgi:hypothetical protein
MLLSKLTMLSLGYLAYKVTADVEKLPFPIAPVHAEGAIALAERSRDENKRGFRQYCFSIGIMLGAVFGLVYVAIPILSKAVIGRPIHLIPIPFLDLTIALEDWLPAGVVGIGLNMALVFIGFVLPWRIVLGSVIAVIGTQIIINPLILQPLGYLPHWEPGKDAIETHVSNTIDLYLSIKIGTAFAIAAVGFFGLGKALMKFSRKRKAEQEEVGVDLGSLWRRDVGRGDPPTWAALLVWLGSAVGFVVLSNHLVNEGIPPNERFPISWLIMFAFLWTPINTYINARMSGIAGQHAGIPYVKEAFIYASGYDHVKIWFAPLPIHNYGGMADKLRVCQLTRTKFSSILRAELLVFPLMLFASFIFWNYITSLGPIPSESYPYVQKFWPQFAQLRALWASGLQAGNTMLKEALKPGAVVASFSVATGAFALFGLAGLSTQYLYGGIHAMNSLPHMVIPTFAGACIGRFYLAKRFGREKWTNYAPILAVGFQAGMGLIGMLAIAINFLWVSIEAGY